MNQTTVERDCVYSRLADDPDLGEIVDMFVEEMPGRIATIVAEAESSDWKGLRQTAHQLKGAAGSYGFDVITPSAGKVEEAISAGESEERIRATVDELVNLCRRVRGRTGGE